MTTKNSILIVMGGAIIIALGYYFGYDHGFERSVSARVDSFEECAAAGYPIMESYPEQCRTPDGRNFVRNIDRTDGGSAGTSTTTSSTMGQVRGTVLLGPQCPVVREGEECPDKPFETSLALTSADGTRVIKTFKSDSHGEFSFEVSPGEYAIRSTSQNILPSCSKMGVFEVKAGKVVELVVSCDTGIR